MDFTPAGLVERAFAAIPPGRLRELARLARREFVERGVFFHYRGGRRRYIPLALVPWVVTAAQRAELRRLCAVLERAAVRVFRARWSRPELQRLLPFTEAEEQRLREFYGSTWVRSETFFSRMDLWWEPGCADWRCSLRVLELNLVGIGAAYYTHCASRVAHGILSPAMRWNGISVEPEDDLIDMIAGRCIAHGRRIGRPRPAIALVENRRILRGPFEFETMAELMRRRGLRVVVADPVELWYRRGRLWARDVAVDVVYRDPTLMELIECEKDGDDLRALWRAFRENRVVSSAAGEIDHKALVEALGDPRFVPAPAVRNRIPWTRLLRAERVTGPNGRPVDLPEFVRRNQQRLVLKPNRGYGGHGVWVGASTPRGRWERVLEEGLRRPSSWVVQEALPLVRARVPVWRRGRVGFVPAYWITGVHATERGVAVLARFSREPVVNITRGGGIAGVVAALELRRARR